MNLFAYAAKVSFDAGFDGVLYFRAKTSELVSYHMKELGAVPLGQYDSFRMILRQDAAQPSFQIMIKEVDQYEQDLFARN